MTVIGDRVNVQEDENSKVYKDYRIILPRLPTGMLVSNSLFLHADITGRPYKPTDFKEALFSIIEREDLIALGPYQMSHVWMAVFANGAAKCKIKACEELVIKQKRCVVIDPTKDEIKLKLLWLPPQLPDSEVKKVLEPFGTVKEITREKWRFSDFEETATLTRVVTLVLKDHLSVDRVPHMLNIYGVNTLVVIPGRPPVCLRCKAVGHIRRHCSTPRCTQCWRFGHSIEECVVTYASKLQGNASPSVDVSEHIMDVEEMFPKDQDQPGDSPDPKGSVDQTNLKSPEHQESGPTPSLDDAEIQGSQGDTPPTNVKEPRKSPAQTTSPATAEDKEERLRKKAKVDKTETYPTAEPCCSKDDIAVRDEQQRSPDLQEQRGRSKFKDRQKTSQARSGPNV